MTPRTRPAALALASVLALAGCTGDSSRPMAAPAGGDAGYVAGDGSITRLAAADREPAPAVEGTTLDGATLRLADFRGDVVVVNVWASWCGPCREETPALEQVWDERRGEGVQFVGINTKDDPPPARAFVRSYGVSYPSLTDPDGSLLLAFRETLPPNEVPSTLVLDRQGRVAARVLSKVSAATLSDLLDDVAAEPKA